MFNHRLLKVVKDNFHKLRMREAEQVFDSYVIARSIERREDKIAESKNL